MTAELPTIIVPPSSAEMDHPPMTEEETEEKYYDNNGETGKEVDDDVQSSPAGASSVLPKESEQCERKRPAAIQELLEKKRARLVARAKEDEEEGEDGEEEHPPRTTTAPKDNNGATTMMLGHLLAEQREDAETVSSSGSSTAAVNGASAAINNNGTLAHQQQSPFASSAIGELNLGQLLKRAFDPQMFAAIQETMLRKYALANGINSSNSSSAAATAALAAALLTTTATSGGGGAATTPVASASPSPVKTTAEPKDTSNGYSENPLISVPNDRIFSQVPGRLSLLSNVVKYKMTVGEIKRRLTGPESFNFSLLGAMLRRAKMPEKSAMLMGELNNVGLSIPRGRRRLSQVTLLSALTETESTQFARDFKKLAESDFPAQQMASELGRQQKCQLMGRDTIRARLEKLEGALRLTEEFLAVLEQDRSPIMDTVPETVLKPEIQEPLSTFSMLTHGFGNPAIQVGVNCFAQCLRHQIHTLKEQLRERKGA